MYISLGQRRYLVSVKQFSPFIFTLILVSLLTFLLSIGKPIYEINTTLISNQPLITNIQKVSLKGVDRSVRRLLIADYRQKRQSSVMELQTKLALLGSWQVMEGFISEYNLKPKLFPDSWDENHQRWKTLESGMLVGIIQFFKSKKENAGTNFSEIPSTWEAVNLLSKQLNIQHSQESGFIRVSLSWEDPKEGAELVNNFIAFTNEFIAQREQNDARVQIAKVKDLLGKQEVTLMQKVLLVELENLQQSLVMANQQIKSAFTVLDPAMQPEEPEFRVPIFKLIFIFIVSIILTLIGKVFLKARYQRV